MSGFFVRFRHILFWCGFGRSRKDLSRTTRNTSSFSKTCRLTLSVQTSRSSEIINICPARGHIMLLDCFEEREDEQGLVLLD
jgi:hypothetical protein